MLRAQELCESRGNHPGPPSLLVYTCLCGRKAMLEDDEEASVDILVKDAL